MTIDMYAWEEGWEEKCWGRVKHVFSSPEIAVSLLKVQAGFRCSRHMHTRRANRFVMVSGKIEVWEWCSWTDMFDHPNAPSYIHTESVSIAAKRPHMFVVRESGLVVEIYTPDGGSVYLTDIIRYDEGGEFSD